MKYQCVGLLFLNMMLSGIQIFAHPDLFRERQRFSNMKLQSYLLDMVES